MSSGHLHPQYNLRWPEELKNKIAESAKAHNRSMNADIVARLEGSFIWDENDNRTVIRAMEYHPLDSLNFLEKRVECAKRITQFLQDNPYAKIINIESVNDGVIFWYSSTE